jgi:hypothetical protein
MARLHQNQNRYRFNANAAGVLERLNSSPPSRKGGTMRRARIVRIEWDDHDLEPTNDLISDAVLEYLGAEYTVSGEPSVTVKEDGK